MTSGFPLTTAYMNELQAQHKAFNDKCRDDLKEMNQTKITNIIERGGVEGWDEGSNLESLTKTFEFTSFEQAQKFVQSVGKVAEKSNHHPEWSSSNGGKDITVKLTSHFAGNKVTIFDFELAEQMNLKYDNTLRTFKPYPWITEKQLLSLCIGVGTFVFAYSVFQLATAQEYESDWQRGAPLEKSGKAAISFGTLPIDMSAYT